VSAAEAEKLAKVRERFATTSAAWPKDFQAPASPVKLEPLTPEGERAVRGLSAWGKEVAKGDLTKSRPFPVGGSWNVAAGQFSPDYLVQLISEGHHVAVAFEDPQSAAFGGSTLDGRVGPDLQKKLDEYYRPAMEFAKAHNLPIVFRGWNWGSDPVNFQTKLQGQRGVEFQTDELAAVLEGGVPSKSKTDPLGPVAAWQSWGRFWFGNRLIQELQSIYPNPPLVLFLNNNESGDLHVSDGYEKSDRFVAKFGDKEYDKAFVDKVIRDGYAERYAAMLAAAKDVLKAPAWKQNVRFIAYNTIFGASQFGRDFGSGDYPYPDIWFDNEQGLVKWRFFDGSMPEMYDNDWQPAKRDYAPWNMQMEMGSVHAYENFIRKERPDFISGLILWDGAVTNAVFRGRRGSSKPFHYASRGLRWGFDRYEGWITFGLWTVRPSLFWEFRAGEPLDAVRLGTWLPTLRAIDQVWSTPELQEFWTSGRLVPNTEEAPWFNKLPDGAPEWLKSMNRWYLLTSDANPPREQWTINTTLRVIAQALELGEKPNRRWLVVAHAPERPTASTTIQIPDFGPVKLPSLGQTCSFFVVKENDGSIATLFEGGPAALELQVVSGGTESPAGTWLAPRSEVKFEVALVHPANQKVDEFVWSFGEGPSKTEKASGQVSHQFAKEGEHLVTVEARKGGKTVASNQMVVYVGTPPAKEVVYHLSLDKPLDWKGPWAGAGENGRELVTYQHLPNLGSFETPVVVGGKFVDDPERGQVYEMTGAANEGIYLQRGLGTVLRGGTPPVVGPEGPAEDAIEKNRTISFWFKAADVQTRQVLFAEGFQLVGMNIYLDGGNLYAGCFATANGTMFPTDPVSGYNWPGEWISTPVEAGKWYQVTWVLANASNKIEPDKQALYLNGKLIGRAPAAGLPTSYVAPRIGRTNMQDDFMNGRKNSLTRFHDEAERDKVPVKERTALNTLPVFKGRIDDFRYVNAVELPETKTP
jgi:hypothetical protein